MFLYISLLKAPPLVSPPSRTINITPQISNDLRTEPFDQPQDIFYAWSPYTSKTNGNLATMTTTKPLKLTTWRASNAYKEIPVPPPQGVREGQAWRLVLTAQPQSLGHSRPESIDLRPSDVGTIPFPVISLPILFSSRGGKQGLMKQEKIERSYVLSSPALEGSASVVEPGTNQILWFTEQTSFDLDKKIWDSGIGVASWMCGLRDTAPTEMRLKRLHEVLFSTQPLNVVELGSGIGIVSVALSALRSTITLPEGAHDNVYATDVPSAMPLLEHNITSNASTFSSKGSSPKALVLDWDEETLPEEVRSLSRLDLILMADVTYNTSSFPSLLSTLSKLIKFGPSFPIVLFGYKERDVAERTWFSLSEEIGVKFEKIGERVGAGGDAVEIWAALEVKQSS